MPEFSACYFCGTALDAPLAEYPVVPESLHPSADQQRTVVLCSSCRRKLGAVVDAVVGAVDDAPSEASVQQDLEAAGDGADEGTTDTDGAGEDTTGSDGADDPADSGISVEAVDGHRAVEESDAEPADADDGGFEFEATSEDPPAGEPADEEADASVASEDTDDGGTLDDSATIDDATDDDAAEDATDDDAADDTTDDDTEGDADEPQLTALEYNKVMRLLQNREFPIDHEEFKIVATNAYEISDEEFDAIIEAAANRDLIGLEGGQIVDS